MSGTQPKSSVRDQTRQQLIMAAERLFAESGIDGVSLRQINLAAGQKNSSAAHYHFGSKEALILSIYQHRMEHVNQRRLVRLAELESRGKQLDVRAIVSAIVEPIVAEIDADASGRNYICFMAQAIGHPQLNLAELWQQDHSDGLVRAVELLRGALPDIPGPIFGQRFGLAFAQLIHSLADREKARKSGTTAHAMDADLFVNNLIDCLSGAMMAPISAQTRAGLKRLKAKTT